MGAFEDSISKILADPEQMEQISALAQSLLGGGSAEEAPPVQMPAAGGMPDAAMLQRLGRLMSASSASDGREQALLAAMKPYLSEKRRAKMDRAMQLAHMAKLAQLALSEAGGEDDV